MDMDLDLYVTSPMAVFIFLFTVFKEIFKFFIVIGAAFCFASSIFALGDAIRTPTASTMKLTNDVIIRNVSNSTLENYPFVIEIPEISSKSSEDNLSDNQEETNEELESGKFENFGKLENIDDFKVKTSRISLWFSNHTLHNTLSHKNIE